MLIFLCAEEVQGLLIESLLLHILKSKEWDFQILFGISLNLPFRTLS